MYFRKIKRNIFIFIFVWFSIFFVSVNSLFANSYCFPQESEQECKQRLIEKKRKLEEEVKRLEEGIKKEGKKQSLLTKEILKLNAEIYNTSKAIREKEQLIRHLKTEILTREERINALNKKLAREKESLAKILRKRYEIGTTTLFEFLLSGKTFSQYYRDLPLFSYIQKSLSDSFHEIERIKKNIFQEKEKLEEKKEEHADEKYKLALEKGKIEVQKKERDLALQVSRSKKATLAELKKRSEEEIRRIRSILIQFQGSGIQNRSISFGEAYDYAKLAEKYTGVRASFILAIMQQETGFGKNVGGCYVTDFRTGDGIGIHTKLPYEKVMGKASLPYFQELTRKLGLNPRKTPVSCPIDVQGRGSARKYYPGRGYGGAMGYTQFIPSSWKKVADRVKRYLGISVANPWNPRDAVMATAIYLKDVGASAKTYTAEYNAACRYYGICGSYAPSVMARIPKIQKLIDTLERNS